MHTTPPHYLANTGRVVGRLFCELNTHKTMRKCGKIPFMTSLMTLRDRKIVEMFAGGATPDEVEDALGVPAAKALHRCKEILGAKDIFDEVEERKLVVTQYQALYQKGHALLDATGVKDWPKGVEALTKLLTALLEARKQEEYRSDREIEAMTRAQASILIRAVQLSYDRARELLAREYPQVDLLEIDAAFQSGLRELSNE